MDTSALDAGVFGTGIIIDAVFVLGASRNESDGQIPRRCATNVAAETNLVALAGLYSKGKVRGESALASLAETALDGTTCLNRALAPSIDHHSGVRLVQGGKRRIAGGHFDRAIVRSDPVIPYVVLEEGFDARFTRTVERRGSEYITAREIERFQHFCPGERQRCVTEVVRHRQIDWPTRGQHS